MIVLDFETRSRQDIGETGVTKYLSCPDFGVLVVAVKFDDQPAAAIYRGNSQNWAINRELISRIGGKEPIVAHNVGFDYRVYCKWAERMGWPETHINQWICTQTAAYAAGLPGKLGEVGQALGYGGKMASGTRLINQLSKPDKAGNFNNDHKKLLQMVDYAIRDVELTAMVLKRLGPVIDNLRSPIELAAQQADYKLNNTGLPIDIDAVSAAIRINQRMSKVLDDAMATRTGGQVNATSQLPALLKYAKSWIPNITSIAKDAIIEWLKDPKLPRSLRFAFKIRLAASNTSVSKYEAMLNMLMPDHRIRDTLRIYGTFTGRWAGRIVQTQNLPKGDIEGYDNASLAQALSDTKALPKGVPWGRGLSAAIRGCIRAPRGSRLLVSDYNAIECRILAWLAREEGLLKLFSTPGGDPYKPMAAKILGKPVAEVTKEERNKWGKATVLGCGYQMGDERFAKENKVPLEFARLCVSTYRAEHKRVKRLWKDAQNAAGLAIANPGNIYPCSFLRFQVVGEFLTCILPSGRKIFYWCPSVEWVQAFADSDTLTANISYWSRYQSTVVKTHTYGGKLVENACQAIARDVIVNGIVEADRLVGLDVFLQVHDEVVAEIPESYANFYTQTLEECLLSRQPWMGDLPLAVESWNGERYKK